MSLLYNFNGVSKLTTTSSLSKLEEVPAWGVPAVARAPHSAGAMSESASPASNRTIDRAEPCFITKVSAYTHQQAHWVNPMKEKITAVESFLISQGIVEQQFSLDGASNLANFDASLHIAMDKYAMFTITCSNKFLDKYIEIVTAENEVWRSRFADGNFYIRNLKALDPSVRFAQYELVVLQPDHFLPNDSLLPLYLRLGQQRLGQGKVEKVKQYKIDADRMLREHTGHDSDQSQTRSPRFHPFLFIAAFYNPVVVDEEYYNDDVSVDDDWTCTNDGSNDSTVQQTVTGGPGTTDMDPNYWRYMLSGRDLELNDNDLDVLREIQESNRAASSHGHSLEKVDNWRRETAGEDSKA